MGLVDDLNAEVAQARGQPAEVRSLGGVPWVPWESPYVPYSAGGPLHPARQVGTLSQQDAALRLAPVYACVRVLADGVAKLPLQQYRDTGDRKVKMPPGQLLSQPSAYGNLYDWLFTAMTSLALHGNAYGLITARDGYGLPTTIEWLPPDQVTVEDSTPWVPGKAIFRYYGGDLPRENLLHVRAFAVPGRTEAVSPLKYFQTLVESGRQALEYGTDWYRAGGFPPGTFQNTAYEVTDEQATEIKRALVRAIRRREPLVHGVDWKFTPISVPPNEAQFVEAMQLNATQIASIYGVMPRKAGGIHGDSQTYCVDMETEILSQHGWLSYDAVKPGDICLTMNVNTGLAEWQPVQAVNVFDGPHEVAEWKNASHSSVTTLDHRWPVWLAGRPGCRDVWRWRTTETFPMGGRIAAALPGSAPAEAKWSDALAELVAWFWTEGWIGAHGEVVITQSEKVNPGHCARIRAALTAAFGTDAKTRGVSLLGSKGWEGRERIRAALGENPGMSNYALARLLGVDDHTVALVRRGKLDGPGWSEFRESRGIVRFRLNVQAGRVLLGCAPDKIPDPGFLSELTTAQLELFIRISLDADGSQNNNGTWVMAQKDQRRVEAFQIACALAGLSGRVRGPNRWGMWYMAVQSSPWRGPCAKRQYVTRKTIDGPAWCPTTPNGTWFARRDGTTYFTGNSNVAMDQLNEVTETLDPWLVRFETALNGCLPAAQSVSFNRDARIRYDITARYGAYKVARDAGFLTVNDILELEDREPQAGGIGSDPLPLEVLVAMARGIKEIPKSFEPLVTESETDRLAREQAMVLAQEAQASPAAPPPAVYPERPPAANGKVPVAVNGNGHNGKP